jgi:hypothetical protein
MGGSGAAGRQLDLELGTTARQTKQKGIGGSLYRGAKDLWRARQCFDVDFISNSSSFTMVEIWKRFFLGNLAAVRTPNELGHRWSESMASSSRYACEVVGQPGRAQARHTVSACVVAQVRHDWCRAAARLCR